MFTALLRSNERGADHRKRRSSIVTSIRFRGKVFTSPCLTMNCSGFQASSLNMIEELLRVYRKTNCINKTSEEKYQILGSTEKV
jgi:hypothetical protein